MRKIEDNLGATFYSGEKIAIDPASHQGTDFTREYFNIEPAYHFPEIVFRPTEGEVMEAITLSSENIWRIHPVDENNLKKIERQIQKGHQLLAEHYPVLTETSKPEAIAAAIQAISNSFRKGEDRKFTAKELQLFKALDYLLAEQAVRAFGWQWYMYEIREQVLDFDNPVIVSPDRDYFWGNLGLFLQRVSKIGGELQFVEDLFEAMRNIDEFKEKQYKQRAEWYPDSSEEEIQNMPRNLPDGLTEVSHLKETIWE